MRVHQRRNQKQRRRDYRRIKREGVEQSRVEKQNRKLARRIKKFKAEKQNRFEQIRIQKTRKNRL